MQVIDSTIFRYLAMVPARDEITNVQIQMTHNINFNEDIRKLEEPIFHNNKQSIYNTLMCKEISHDMKMRLIASIDSN